MKDVLTYKGFVGSVQFLSKEEKFVGKLMNVNEEVTFEGDSHTSLTEDFHKVVDSFISKSEATYTGKLNCAIDKPLHEKLVKLASKKGLSLNEYIIELLEKA